MVVHPGCAWRKIRGSHCLVQNVVAIKTDCLRLPFNCKNVEGIGELFSLAKRVPRAKAFAARVPGAVNCSMNGRWLFPDQLHNVDLTALGPTYLGDIVTQQPKCGPDSLSTRQLYPRFESAVCSGKGSFGD